MKRLLKNGKAVNVFTDTLEEVNVLLEDDRIIGVGDYGDGDADVTDDMTGKIICPGFTDGHIHIESSMLHPSEFARVCLLHGTTTVIADPHEIANVSGIPGIRYMLQDSENLPLHIYFMVPSCVPATPFDESGAVLGAEDIASLFGEERVLGLGEMMNYPGVLGGDPETLRKLEITRAAGLKINGHAPLITGRDLDRYIACGIGDDHECSSFEEAAERIRKGQWLMIRQGTAARNLEMLLPLFEEPYNHRCLLVTDDKHPADLLQEGHIDSILARAVRMGKSPLVGIRMATLQAAQCFGLMNTGAIAPGYRADLTVLSDLETFRVSDVYTGGEKVVSGGVVADFPAPRIGEEEHNTVRNSFRLDELRKEDFALERAGKFCRVIEMIPGQLLTREVMMDAQEAEKDEQINKLAVIERHHHTGHIGLGYVRGMGITCGAVASSVSHDSHNLIVAGSDDEDMALAANRVREMGGGLAVVGRGRVLAEMPLPIAGLMSDLDAARTAEMNREVLSAVREIGVPEDREPFMSLAFISLPVIPSLKMTTQGLVNVDRFERVPLFEA